MRYLFVFILINSFATKGSACDICGCFMGITQYDNQSSIGMFYRMRYCNGCYSRGQSHAVFPSGSLCTSHGGTNGGSSGPVKAYSKHNYEKYRVIELRARYFIHQRIELNVILPYIANGDKTDQVTSSVSGNDDIHFMAAYHLMKKMNMQRWQHRLITGAGIKLPAGLASRKNEHSDLFDTLLQPGTGTTDYFFYANYVLGYRKLGISANASYKINEENKFSESVSNSFTAYMNLFYKFSHGSDIIIIPSAQSYYEYTKGLQINDELQAGTLMNLALLGPGLEIFYKNVSLLLAYQLPVYEKRKKTE